MPSRPPSRSAQNTALARLARAVSPSIRARFDALRRDLSMVGRALGGDTPSPFVKRSEIPRSSGAKGASGSSASPGSVLAPHRARVVDVVRETADCVTLVLERADSPPCAPYAFLPGQFFTLLAEIDGAPLRRAYSASSSALETSRVSITVKRVPGGKLSNYLNDVARVGMVLELLGPSGSFTPPPRERGRAERHAVLIGGGSGITPLYSIAQTLLARDETARVTLIDGNRTAADIIFERGLAALGDKYPTRFTRRFVLENPPTDWPFGTGLLDRANTLRELAEVDARLGLTGAEYYVCGPSAMMAEVRAALRARGAPRESVHEERFDAPHLRRAGAHQAVAQTAMIYVGSVATTAVVAAGETLLEAALRAGVAMPYSCAMGGCGACQVTLLSGDVDVEEPNCLSPDERAAGRVLSCIARPKGPVEVKLA